MSELDSAVSTVVHSSTSVNHDVAMSGADNISQLTNKILSGEQMQYSRDELVEMLKKVNRTANNVLVVNEEETNSVRIPPVLG